MGCREQSSSAPFAFPFMPNLVVNRGQAVCSVVNAYDFGHRSDIIIGVNGVVVVNHVQSY